MHAGEPDVRGPELLEFRNRRFVEVVEFADPVFLDEAVFLAGLVGVSKKAREHLVDANFREVEVPPAAHRVARRLAATLDLEKISQRDLARARWRVGRKASIKISPAVFRGQVLAIRNESDFFRITEHRLRDAQRHRSILAERGRDLLRVRARAPLGAVPPADRSLKNLPLPLGNHDHLRLERQKNRRSLATLAKRNDHRTPRTRAHRRIHRLTRAPEFAAGKRNLQPLRTAAHRVRDSIRAVGFERRGVHPSRDGEKRDGQETDKGRVHKKNRGSWAAGQAADVPEKPTRARTF